MSFTSATHGSTMHTILFCVISFLALNVSANCNNNNCLKALRADTAVASSFCSVYTTDTAIATPVPISSACKAEPSKILSACSCVNVVTTTTTSSSTSLASKSSSTTRKTTVSTSPTTQSSVFRSTSSTTTGTTSSSASQSTCQTILPSTVTVTIVSTTSITAFLPPTTVTQTQTQTQTATTTTSLYPSPCSLYEAGIPSCVLSNTDLNFADFEPGCLGIGTGPNYVSKCICPYLSQLSAYLQTSGCAAADITNGLMFQKLECQCLGATIG